MSVLQGGDIADLVSQTLQELNPLRWTEIATDLQEHVAARELLRKSRVTFQSGYGIKWSVMTDHSNAARNVGLFSTDNVNVGDVMTTAEIPWRHTNSHYAFERREIKMNREPARIVELLKIRRADAMISMAEKLEANFWSQPTSSSDKLDPFGVDYWIVPAVNGEDPGFYDGSGVTGGGNPYGFSAGAGGLSSATYNRWSNWCADYTTIDKTDLIRKWREAATKTRFMSPTEIPALGTATDFGYYTNYNVIGRLEEVLEAQNDNLGSDIASQDGRLLFRRVPVMWVPYLDSYTGPAGTSAPTTADPIYGINWGVFKPCFLEGEYMVEEGPEKAANQHTTYHVQVDMTYNFLCYNRRKLFRLDKVSA